jgi:hypothetical protein
LQQHMGCPCHDFLTWEVDNAWKMATSIQMIPSSIPGRSQGCHVVLNRYNYLVAKALEARPLIGLSSLSVAGFDNGPALTRRAMVRLRP